MSLNPLGLLGEIHSSNSVTSGSWRTYREQVTGMYLLSGGLSGPMPWYNQHLIREFNRKVDSRYKSWTGEAPVTTGLFIDPYDGGFSYQGTGDFREYP
jgi:acetone carboxylase gamma subunit|tara:strand:- start:282 stop:575 length:294 start_codon:yes stop_codon:yes gene_type:complete